MTAFLAGLLSVIAGVVGLYLPGSGNPRAIRFWYSFVVGGAGLVLAGSLIAAVRAAVRLLS